MVATCYESPPMFSETPSRILPAHEAYRQARRLKQRRCCLCQGPRTGLVNQQLAIDVSRPVRGRMAPPRRLTRGDVLHEAHIVVILAKSTGVPVGLVEVEP